MIFLYFVYGLAYFCLGIAVLPEARRTSKLPLGRQLPWLAAFGLLHAIVEWADMFMQIRPGGPWNGALVGIRSVLLPLSALLLVRFGVGLINEAGPLPSWLTFAPVVLLVPAGLLVGYALIISFTEPPLSVASDVWSRYLLYLPGNLFSAFAFFRQWRSLKPGRLNPARAPLFVSALAFCLNAIVAGLVVPDAAYGLAGWLNYSHTLAWTGIPVQVWRAASAVVVTLFVIRALGVFEAERREQLAELEAGRRRAQEAFLAAQSEARRSAEAWNEALVSISRRIANMEDVEHVLLAIVDTARKLLKADLAAVGLWDENGSKLLMKCLSLPSGFRLMDAEVVQSPVVLQALRACRSLRYPEEWSGPALPWTHPGSDKEVRAGLIAPLKLEDKTVGGLWVGRSSSLPFNPGELVSLERLSDQAVISIEHALMAGRLQSLAVVEERGRIAREMHDGLAQILGYLNLQMQTLEALAVQGDRELIVGELKQTRQQIALAQADVRENILSLRTTLADSPDVELALREYVEEFGIQTGIESQFICEAPGLQRLSALAETQMVRVVQEALTNVRKHAQARQVMVRIGMHHGCLCVSIVDDGVGFELPAGRGHYGLLTMRERAESVGGGLTVTSQAGGGTQVELWLPMVQKVIPTNEITHPSLLAPEGWI